MKKLIVAAAVVLVISVVAYSQAPRRDREGRRDGRPPRDPFLELFDTDKNGEISTEEMEQATAILKKLDRNKDGSLTREELPRPPRPEDRERGRRRGDEEDRDRRRPPRAGRGERDDRVNDRSDLENARAGTVVFLGGYETDPRDGGRPVTLIAAALGVKSQVFRDAFSNVRPARGGDPTPQRARANKEILMAALGKYGISNERLDEVSNYYRYQPERGEVWRRTPAAAKAVIKNGVVQEIKLTSVGAGYTTPPEVVIAGHEDVKIEAKLGYSKDFRKNGRIVSLEIVK